MNKLNQVKEFVNEHKLKIIVGLIATIVVLMVTLFIMINDRDVPAQSTQNLSNSNQAALQSNQHHSQASSRSQPTFVDVEGAVKKPGVYRFTSNMRIDDAVNLAGGLTRSADRKHIDLAKKLVDQQTVYIPVKGEIKGVPAGASQSNSGGTSHPDSSRSGSSNSSQVNINTADQSKLQSINGIGPKRAQKIISYRKSHGDFKSVEDIKKGPGIGDKFFANIKSHITV